MTTFKTSSLRPVAGLLIRYRKHRNRVSDIRLIEQLPERLKKDIGWPPFGDLGDRHCS